MDGFGKPLLRLNRKLKSLRWLRNPQWTGYEHCVSPFRFHPVHFPRAVPSVATRASGQRNTQIRTIACEAVAPH